MPPTTANLLSLHNGAALLKPMFASLDGMAIASPLGGLSDVFPANGFAVSIEAYIDFEHPEIVGENRGFIFALALTDQDNANCRPGIIPAFLIGTNDDATEFCGQLVTNELVDPITACDGGVSVLSGTPSGWYQIVYELQVEGGELIVTARIQSPGTGTLLEEETGGLFAGLGGNNLAYLPGITLPGGLQIRNSSRRNL